MYSLIDHVMKIFDLIIKIEVSCTTKSIDSINQFNLTLFILFIQDVQKKALISRDFSSFKMLD